PAAIVGTWSSWRGLMLKRWQGLILCGLLVVPAVSYFSSKQCQELVSEVFPAIAGSRWLTGPGSLVLPLINGCCTTAAWLCLLATTARASKRNAAASIPTTEALIAESHEDER